MDNKKIMNEFRKYMGKKHWRLNGWIVIWLTSALYLMITGNKVAESLERAYLAGAILFVMAAVHTYVRKYTRFYFSEMRDVKGPKLQVHADLEDVIRSLSFDPAAYFIILGKRLLPVQICSAVTFLLAGALKLITLEKALIIAVIYLAVPWIYLVLKAYELQWYMTHACGAGRRFLIGAVGAFADLCRILMMGISFLTVTFEIIGLLGSNQLLEGVNEQEAVRFSSNVGIWIVIIVVASIMLSLFASGAFDDANYSIWGKARRVIIAGLLAAFVLATGVYCYQLTHNHVKITETSVTVRRGGVDTVYGLDEIASYRIYCRSENLEMELCFRDGKTATLFGDATEETDAWNDKYYGDASYAAYLVDYLTMRGVRGTLEDREEIEDVMRGYDAELRKGFQHVVEVIGK